MEAKIDDQINLKHLKKRGFFLMNKQVITYLTPYNKSGPEVEFYAHGLIKEVRVTYAGFYQLLKKCKTLGLLEEVGKKKSSNRIYFKYTPKGIQLCEELNKVLTIIGWENWSNPDYHEKAKVKIQDKDTQIIMNNV